MKKLLYFVGASIFFLALFFVISSLITDSSSTNEEIVNEQEVDEEAEETELTSEEADVKTEEEEMAEFIEQLNEADITSSQREVIKVFEEDYLAILPLSKKALIKDSVRRFGFSEEDATFAANYISFKHDIDWQEQAIQSAQNLLDYTSYSRDGLIETLVESRLFSEEHATFAADYVFDKNDVDTQEQAILMAEEIMEGTSETSSYSKKELIEVLVDVEGFSKEEATFAADYVESENIADWQEQANRAAVYTLSVRSDYSRDGLIELLMNGGFTKKEATNAVNHAGL